MNNINIPKNRGQREKGSEPFLRKLAGLALSPFGHEVRETEPSALLPFGAEVREVL